VPGHQRSFRILFAGGGTGGHVFPGVALAQRAVAQEPTPDDPRSAAERLKADVFWLCTSRPFDAAQLSRAGIPHRALASPRWRGFTGFLAPMARAILDAAREIRRFKPDVLVGVGGYGTVPPVLAAKALGIPYVLLEQNVRPGKANRFLAVGAQRIYVQWPQARNAFPGRGSRVLFTGSPLRDSLRPVPRERALERFGLRADLPTVAVVGGSQGSEALNRGAVAGLDGAAPRLQLIHVAGPQADAVRAAYQEKGARAEVRDFVQEMDLLYSAADLIVSRAGAMAIAEIAAFGVPAVLVPISRSAGDHQRENARAVVKAGGAILMEEPDCLAGGLAPVLRKLVARDPVFEAMRRGLRPLARAGAADAILADLRGIMAR
jgi:UDP-N-acetylglucosamine--N-acetylmuramyl-(pentapeptide) pyrophosphoryl-undecaprenol N-acetylglucosamine transferase